MELISTHLGADFDAVASMLAAKRLHPGAELFFPGSREESVRRLLATGLVELAEVKRRHVDPAAIERLVLCDIRQRRRIGVVAEWLEEHPGIEVVVYDHHPESDDDLAAAGGVVDPTVGATSTLMVERFAAAGLEPTRPEATLLLMGIYEDTGSLTYASTSPRDLAAAGWLLERGGDLTAVHRWALQRLDSTHLDVLHRMTHEIDFVRVSGHRVGVVALELGRYVDELAPLVSRCLDLYELPFLFALFGEGDHVTLIARGRVPGVEVGQLVAPFGGGGHATAAAARLAGRTVLEVREELLAHLAAVLPPAARAGDLAIADFVVIAAGTSVADAKAQLVERRVNAAPVAAPDGGGQAGGQVGGLSGAVTRQILDAALQHGLGERPVERVMAGGLEWVAADAPAEEVAERMLERHPRFVLVGDPATGRAEGLITRMQVMRHLHARLAEEELSLDRAEHLRTRKESAGKLLALLPPPLDRQVAAARKVARREGIAAYVVGGPVRDLLLAAEGEAAGDTVSRDSLPRDALPRDLDLVVEGDGPHFAHLLAAELDGRVREHRAFLTAVVIDPDGRHVDVATARSEFYRQPAALPEVATSALRQDLYRRDFTINTLVIRLGPGDEPALLDHFGGRRDLDEGTIRVLHSLSFIDDPTRALRAVRLEQRLGFEIAPETLHLMRVAHEEGAFDRLSGSRLREELKLLLDDPAVALRGIERLDDLGLTPALDPALVLGAALRARLRGAVGAYHWFRFEGLDEPEVELWRLLLVALAESLPGAEGGEGESGAERFAARLMLAGDDHRVVAGAGPRLAAARRLLRRPEPRPHEVAAALEGSPGEDLLLLLAGESEPARSRVRLYLTDYRRFELSVRGADLVAAGVPPGPAIGGALAATRDARLDGEIAAADELAFALASARRVLVREDGAEEEA